MDEIQYASDRDLAIGNVDRESTLLRSVRAHWREYTTGFGTALTVNRRSAQSASRLCHGAALYPVSGDRGPRWDRAR